MKRLIKSLSPLEKRVLAVLKNNKTLQDIEASSGLKQIEVMRALQWLENKNLIKINTELKEIASLDKNGLNYFKNEMPERKFLKALDKKELSLNEIKEKTKLSDEEINVSIGVLKSKAALSNVNNKFKLNEKGLKLLEKSMPEERLVHELGNGIKETKILNEEERAALNNLRKRKNIIKIDVIRARKADLLEKGIEILKEDLSEELLEKLSSNLLKSGEWRKKEFREYDVKTNLPKIYGGKRHFVNQAVEYAKRIWLDMGFKEMNGNVIQTSFWNFDALFVPQDHPARELQDTYFLNKKGSLPNKELVNKVKKAHEVGVCNSKGWQYKWNEEEAKRMVLRTHTTVLSAQTLAKLKKTDLPAKFFAIGRNYRNEALDWSHLFEFNQTEGIVVDENANFRHLLGYLKEFFKKMGFEKARFRPAYFPYVEPSVEIDVYHPIKKQWVELGGAGIFRPEVVEPLLGKAVPVLAWGPGFDRIIMDYYKIKDIRELYKNDIKQLRNIKTWMK